MKQEIFVQKFEKSNLLHLVYPRLTFLIIVKIFLLDFEQTFIYIIAIKNASSKLQQKEILKVQIIPILINLKEWLFVEK